MKITLFLFILLSLATTAFGQNRSYRVQVGATHFFPNYVRDNVRIPSKSLPSFQASIGRDFQLTKFLDFSLGLGLNRNGFETVSLGEDQKIWLTYLSLEPGFVFKKVVKEVSFFAQTGVHLSRLINDNYRQFYPFQHLSSADFGASLSLGVRWEKIPLRPYLMANYRRSLKPISSSSFFLTTNSNEPILRSQSFSNESIGFLLGIYVW